jgi:multisubunit Na+/H+ antiporter MnhG subunit
VSDNHGQTPAAWTGTILIILASIISTLGVIVANWNIFWGGIALAVLATVIWIVWEKSSKAKK